MLKAGAAGGVSWEEGPNARHARLQVAASDRTGFSRLPSSLTGMAFANRLSEDRSSTNRNLLSGSGVAAGDVDGDGLCDVYFTALDGDNVLYRNLGNWKFEDVTAEAGVACRAWDCMGAAFADTDGDGDLDLIVNTVTDGTHLFVNGGRGRFTDLSAAAGLTSKRAGTSVALADVDGDGDLDLYSACYRASTIADRPTTRFRFTMVDGVPKVALVDGLPATLPEYTNRFVLFPSGRVMELGEADVLYLNEGANRFRALSFTDGAFLDEDGKPLDEPPRDWSLAVQIRDLNEDGTPDIYVCSDLFTPDRVWLGDGRGRFRAVSSLALRNTSTFSMGVDMADVDRDGHPDLFVTDMLSREHVKRHVQVSESSPMRWPVGVIDLRPQFNRNTLQMARGDGTFAETAFLAGLEASEWSWGPIFLDVDLDGYEDLLVPNGQWGDFQNADMARKVELAKAERRLSMQELSGLVRKYPRLETRNVAFHNRGNGVFEEVGGKWGFATPGISQGACLADLDNDGDLDVLVNNLNGECGVYRNEGAAPRVAVRLRGRSPNSQGVGARIRLISGVLPEQQQEMLAGGRYLSGDEPLRTFAAPAGAPLRIEVTWRDGTVTVVSNVAPNHAYEVAQAGASVPPSGSKGASPVPLFEDRTALLHGHVHEDEPFDDFVRQPLLPWRLSQPGPGIAWGDVDGDGRDDLVVGSGKGGRMSVFLWDGQGGFRPLADSMVGGAVTRDMTGVLIDRSGRILGGSSNYEDGMSIGGAVRLYDLSGRRVEDAVGGQPFSAGPLAEADVDGDGDLDLFLGGRVMPGRYPEPATSVLLRNEGNKWVVWQTLDGVGLVSGAVFSDLDGDAVPELVLACEWGPVQILQWKGGRYEDATRSWGMTTFTGWWAGVNAGDFDGDGRLDLVASNWGLNSKYRTDPAHPRRAYFGDIDGNGTVDVIEAYHSVEVGGYVPDRGLRSVASAMPFLQERWTSFEAYGKATLPEIYGDRLAKAGLVEVRTLSSTLFLNRGGRFEAVSLAREAQWAPAFSVNIADFDGDGREDLFLSQNFFAMNVEAGRNDAGRGLCLRGDGRGGLAPLRGRESGIAVYGESRGAALADYDADGRVDLVVTQNGNQTRLFRNAGGRPGLRVRLAGRAGNPNGFGVQLRAITAGRPGPMREIHGGSGYLSQDSAIQVLHGLDGVMPEALSVRWPGGREITVRVPPGASEVSVGPDGAIARVR